MSQINPQRSVLVTEPAQQLDRRSGSAATDVAPPQLRRDFNAALRRADARVPQGEPERVREKDSDDPSPEGQPALMLAPGLLGAAAAGGGSEPLGGAAFAALPGASASILPEAMPTNAGAGIERTAAQQQWRVSVPVDNAQGSALAMRLVNAGTGHWQLRLATDNQTRQQLSPHLDRLRDRLRQHSGGRFDDLGFDDEPESAA